MMIFLLCGLYNPVRGWAFGRAISVGFTYGYSRQAPWAEIYWGCLIRLFTPGKYHGKPNTVE